MINSNRVEKEVNRLSKELSEIQIAFSNAADMKDICETIQLSLDRCKRIVSQYMLENELQ